MAHVQFADELVKEYLLFRGFSSSLKAFENDIKSDKDKGFRVDKIVDHFMHSVYNYDLSSLRESWTHLETKIFTRLEHHMTGAARKLEGALYKFYLVHAIENSKTDKVNEFFMKMTQELSSHADWKDWFTIPYIKYPEEHATFALYFTKQWQDSLFVSLHNFLASAYQNLPQPTLSAYEESAAKMAALQKENEILRRGLANLLTADAEKDLEPTEDLSDIIDDFHNISLEVKTAESHANMLKMLKTKKASSPKTLSTSQAQPKRPVCKREETKKLVTVRRDRDSSLDASLARARLEQQKTVEKEPAPSEGGFLFLSQDEYNEHTKDITCMKLNGRGNMVASLDVGGSLRVWSTPPSCRTVGSFTVRAHSHVIEWVLHHERYLLCGEPSGYLKLLDTRDVQQVWELTVASLGGRLENIVSNPTESSAIVLVGGKITVLDLKTRKIDTSIEVSEVMCCAYAQNGRQVVCGYRDGSVQLIDLKNNQILDNLPPLGSAIRYLHLTADATNCIYLDEARQLRCVCIASKDKGQTLSFPSEVQIPTMWNRPFCLDNSGAFLLTLGTHSGLIYKITNDGIVKCLKLGGHKSSVTVIDWSFANQCATCITASSDGNIRVSTLLIDSVASES